MTRAIRRAGVTTLLAAAGVAWLGAARAEAACTLTINAGVAFGAYNIFSDSVVESTGRFNLRCTGGDQNSSVRITLSAGNSGTYTERRLVNGPEFLGYNLYLDAARTIVWGDGSQGSQAYTGLYNGPQRQYFDVFGRIPAHQDAAVGTYTDTITITVNY